jgi:hypothetical protein
VLYGVFKVLLLNTPEHNGIIWVKFQFYVYLKLNFASMPYAVLNWKENKTDFFFSHLYFLVQNERGIKRNVPVDALEVYRWSGDVSCQLHDSADLPQRKNAGTHCLVE